MNINRLYVVRKIAKEGKMKCGRIVTIDVSLWYMISKVIEGEKGLFYRNAEPGKATDGEYRDIAHPINSQTRDRIQGLILEKYQELLAAEEAEEVEEAVAE